MRITLDPEEKYKFQTLDNMTVKDMRRACIVRGIDFYYLMVLDVPGMRQWLIKNWDNPLNKGRVGTFDKWYEENLTLFDFIEEGEFPDGLKLLQGRTSRKYLPMVAREDPNALKDFVPRKGTPKEYVFNRVQAGLNVKEIIQEMEEMYPHISVGTIKVWASKARKQKRLRDGEKFD